MIKIGLVDIDVSHPLTFTKKMLENGIPMKYAYVCNKGFRGKDQVESFAKKYDIQIVDEIEDMVEHVDVGFIQSCNWEKHIPYAMPFIEKGVPVFLDKPMVGSMEDIRKIRQLAASGAKILGSSSVRYAYEIRDFLAKPLEERGEILNIFGTSGLCVRILRIDCIRGEFSPFPAPPPSPGQADRERAQWHLPCRLRYAASR